ncbi:MAG: hypothetical protein RIM23_09950 [Coleofasciculus sp. G3-WIS-01]|uniref:hypothetical protein n=1 Tax=Coleofasciculus sp. G3-WIS-01 TaxID=3069528 RepID=UPI0032F13909
MPLTVTTRRVFNQKMNPGAINRSDRFIGADFLYIIAPDFAGEIEIDAFLQVFLPIGTQRKIQLESPSILAFVNQVNTETVTRIPAEFKGYEMEVVLAPSSDDFLEVWVSGSNSPCDDLEEQLDRIEGKTDLCIAANIIKSVVDIVLNGVFDGVIAGVAKEILGPSARKLFKILNPLESGSPIWVDILPSLPELPEVINQASFETIVQPGFEWQPPFGYPEHHIVGWSDGGIINEVKVREYF